MASTCPAAGGWCGNSIRLRTEPAAGAPQGRRADDYRILVRRNEVGGPGADEPGYGAPDDEATWALTCPAAALSGNLRVRNWRRGDRIAPLGLDGSKKSSDLFRECRLPATARPGVLVVEDDAVKGAVDADHFRPIGQGSSQFAKSDFPFRHQNKAAQAGARGIGGGAGGGIARAGAYDGFRALFEGLRDSRRHTAILERSCRIQPLVLKIQPQTGIRRQNLRQARRFDQGCSPLIERHNRRLVVKW